MIIAGASHGTVGGHGLPRPAPAMTRGRASQVIILRHLQAIRGSMARDGRRSDLNAMMSSKGWRAFLMSAVVAAGFAFALTSVAHATSQRLVVVVNDQPITD